MSIGSEPGVNASAIEVRGIGKRYQLGQHANYSTMRDNIVETFRSWFQKKDEAEGADILWAIRDISFNVRRGEIVGVIGRNGSGKSTLLKILSRIVDPTEGSASICGRVAALLEVGTGLHPELTGEENIYLSGSILGLTRGEIREKYKEIVEFAELDRFLDTPIKRYSSGMRVRLAFSVSVHLDPEILLIDEVLAVGDAAFQKKCVRKMEQVAGGGRTILFVSHDSNTMKSFCNRAIWLKEGHVEEDGHAGKVVDLYLSWLDRLPQ